MGLPERCEEENNLFAFARNRTPVVQPVTFSYTGYTAIVLVSAGRKVADLAKHGSPSQGHEGSPTQHPRGQAQEGSKGRDF
jgi:hypothetical protein